MSSAFGISWPTMKAIDKMAAVLGETGATRRRSLAGDAQQEGAVQSFGKFGALPERAVALLRRTAEAAFGRALLSRRFRNASIPRPERRARATRPCSAKPALRSAARCRRRLSDRLCDDCRRRSATSWPRSVPAAALALPEDLR
jgi:hypothetical protein